MVPTCMTNGPSYLLLFHRSERKMQELLEAYSDAKEAFDGNSSDSWRR